MLDRETVITLDSLVHLEQYILLENLRKSPLISDGLNPRKHQRTADYSMDSQSAEISFSANAVLVEEGNKFLLRPLEAIFTW